MGLWGSAYLVDAANKFYIRKSALQKFIGDDLKQEVMAGGITKFLLNGSLPAFASLSIIDMTFRHN